MNKRRKRLIFFLLAVNWIFMIASLIAWPLTQLTIAKDEPTFTLGLSWFNIAYTAWNTVITTYLMVITSEDSSNGGGQKSK